MDQRETNNKETYPKQPINDAGTIQDPQVPKNAQAQTGRDEERPPKRVPVIKWLRFLVKRRGRKFKGTDLVMAIATVVIAAWAGLQWWEMHGTGQQNDALISAARIQSRAAGRSSISARQTVADNRQSLIDNRNAIANTLKENRIELDSALKQNRDALDANMDQGKKALDAST